jgi:uncharacterized protein (TIGR02246 family)
MTRFALCVVLTPMTLGSTAAFSADTGQVAAVRAVLDTVVKAWETGDAALFASAMAHDGDMVAFGTDAAERFVGWDVLKASADKQFATYTGTKVAVKHRDIKVGAGGNAAWAAEVLDLSTRSGSEPVTVPGMRVTTVLEKRGGRWLIVHFHYSVPVAGQAIKY